MGTVIPLSGNYHTSMYSLYNGYENKISEVRFVR